MRQNKKGVIDMQFPDLVKRMVRTLNTAMVNGRPLTLDRAMGYWGNGSIWQDLVDSGFIHQTPEAVTVTDSGKNWLVAGCTR